MRIKKWRSKAPQAPTHVLMDGGQLHVPDEDLDPFWGSYLADLADGKKLYVVEQKTERFKFFVDVDFKSERQLTDEDALVLCRKIHESVGAGRCLVARAPVRMVDSLFKSGMHLHWPELVVTKTQALSLRTRILMCLPEGDHWAQVIDSSVYGGSGLRCLWSHKKPEGDPYVPWVSVPDGSLLSPEPTRDALKLFAVRVIGAVTSPGRALSEPTGRESQIESFIRANLVGQENARVKAIRKTKKGEGKGMCVETDSRYCENVGHDHKSNHVWFWMLGGKIRQMCLDEECTGFKGREHNIVLPSSNEHPHMDDSPRPSAVDLLPKAWRGSFQDFRSGSPPVLGSGPPRMEVVPD